MGIPSENIVIENCIFKSGFGVAIGSEMSGGVRDVFVRNCVFENVYSIASIKAIRGRGAYIKNIHYENCSLINHDTEFNDTQWFRGAIYVDGFYGDKEFDADTCVDIDEGTPIVDGIYFKDIIDKDSIMLHLYDDNISNIKNLLWLVSHECGHFTTGSDNIICNCMTNIFICIFRMYERYIDKSKVNIKDSVIDELKKYMKSNFGNKITLKLLAERVHMSREYLSRYFKLCTGKTMLEFLLEIRMSNAKRMLATSNHPVADIAEYCGYPSMSNFQKAFKNNTGMSPREYRNKQKSNQLN